MPLRVGSQVPVSSIHSPEDVTRAALIEHVFTDPAWLQTPSGQADLEAHLSGRTNHNRQVVVPWLDAVAPLRGRRVLEIGCGTGASTQVLAEFGARVIAVDIDQPAINVAHSRCLAHGHDVAFACGNAAGLGTLAPGQFDHILFYATLEHMTHDERLASLREAWNKLASGGCLGVIETPNRLWFRDDHTAQLPFFHWLPDDLAFKYASFSERRGFCDVYEDDTPERRLHFLRRGRGVSIHEFELAIGPRADWSVASCLHASTRHAQRTEAAWRDSPEGLFQRLLQHFDPGLSSAFAEPQLDFVIRKP